MIPSTLFPSVGCKTWHIWFPMVISITQWELISLRDGGRRVWLWVPRTHLIGPFHFWDASRGDVGVHSIWKDRFYFLIPRIESSSGFVDFDFIEMPWQDMTCGSGFSPYRYFNLGF